MTVPALGAHRGVPTGQRGLLAYFRVGADIVAQKAVAVLKIKE